MKRRKDGQLTSEEQKIVKALLAEGQRNQDIQALLNLGRKATVNSARVTEVKQNPRVEAATKEDVQRFKQRKQSYDLQTGLNSIDDERLVRAREAMILAVQIFNSASLLFKTEVFLVLANVAWTYLLHDFYERKKVPIVGKDGRSLLLSQMLNKQDCPLATGQRNNLKAVILLRDEVEHKLLEKSDQAWQALFQACCLNFEEVICKLHGPRVSLAKNLSFSLQFVKPDLEQLGLISNYDLPPNIEALDARLNTMFSEQERLDLAYQFRVVYTLDASNKNGSHVEFVRPDSSQGKEIRNILVSYKSGDHLFPYKAKKVCAEVSKRTKKSFIQHNHTQAWLLYKVRPKTKANQPENTIKEYCLYHPVHQDYTYSDKWIAKLTEAVLLESEFEKIKSVKVA